MLESETLQTDVLIIGGGIAGLYAGVEAVSRKQKVMILVKGPTCSTGIVGFNVALRGASSGDSPSRFFDDLIAGGHYLNDMSLIATMAYESEPILRELSDRFGVEFQLTGGQFAVRRAAGSSKPRTVYRGDSIGPDIMVRFQKYLAENGGILKKGTNCLSLLHDGRKVVGAAALSREGGLLLIKARATVLATGGAGSIYEFCTTPETIDGDGYRLAFEAGAELMDMEFVQFEPFIFVAPPQLKGFSVPTTSVWDGAKLYNTERFEFLPKEADGKVVNLTKDVLSRYIHSQAAAGKGTGAGGVYMDWTALPKEIVDRYPRFVKYCKSKGLDPYITPMEVGPACHHMMGGVVIDKECRTGVPALFAAGEVTAGVHGANRLAGAAGTDVLVFGRRAGIYSAELAAGSSEPSDREFNKVIGSFRSRLESVIGNSSSFDFQDRWNRIRKIMWEKVGIIRNEENLKNALEELSAMADGIERTRVAESLDGLSGYFKLKSAAFVSRLITGAAAMRKESRGDHYREDYPLRDDLNWLKHILVKRGPREETEFLFRNLASLG